MTTFIPVTLAGDTLGQRHRYLNCLVSEAHRQRVPLESLQPLPEHSPLDRLFKIDLASKYRDVDYIVRNLKDDDMLYVSRALKSSWLLETQYRHIINPIYLEEELYPQMITPAVNKMKHWIHLNLRDPNRCEEFFEYYIIRSFESAVKFLWHCSREFILKQATDILNKLTHQHLQLLSEKCPEIVKIFFDSISSNDVVLSNYLDNDIKYYNNSRHILKMNADIFLDITEQYFQDHFGRFSSDATVYIMKNHKRRFSSKPELYTANLLNINALAKCLNKDEIKDLVLKLARAEYLDSWFSYKSVEPLLKQLDVESRTKFKKQVFVDKLIGDRVKEWPYNPPTTPQRKESQSNIFQDEEHEPNDYQQISDGCYRSGRVKKRKIRKKCGKWSCPGITTTRTYLDELFDKYRFFSFEKTLFELRKKMKVETFENRRDIMLVLVSKSGGRPESIEKLLMLLIECHENEPANLRAAIVRSMVKRCSAWRLPQVPWDLLLRFGRDLGLDGAPPTAPCIEGLHAVVLRNLLLGRDCDPLVKETFLEQFSTLKEYSLTTTERLVVCVQLPAMLLSDVEANPSKALIRIDQLLDTLDAYDIQVDRCAGAVPAIVAVIRRDRIHESSTHSLLRRLFRARVARKELFIENFTLIQTDASYLNALKHGIAVLKSGKEFEFLVESNDLQHERFLRSLVLYFGEQDGLAEKYLSVLERKIQSSPEHKLARSLALLGKNKLLSILKTLDAAPKDSASRRLSAALRANAHLARPLVDIDSVGWQYMGAKAVANRVLTCSAVNAEGFIEKLLSWRRTERMALALSMRVGKELSTLATLVTNRPKLALKTALWYNRRGEMDSGTWDIIIPIIADLDISQKLNDCLLERLDNVQVIPNNMKPDYCTAVFNLFFKISRQRAMPMLCNLELILPKVSDHFIETIIQSFLGEEFTNENIVHQECSYTYCMGVKLYVRIMAKFLLLSKSEIMQKKRIKNVAEPFFDRIESFWKELENKTVILEFLVEFVQSLKYTKVFLDIQYVSCLPVFEYVINRLQNILPLELYFDKYVVLHLSMMYFKTIRQGLKNNPVIFEVLSKDINQTTEIVNQATEMVGIIFGKYIAREFIELAATYFESILDLYKVDLAGYLYYFPYCEMRNNLFVASITKGILENEDSKAHLLAEYIYKENQYNMCSSLSQDIYELLKQHKSRELIFFLNADFCSD